MDVNLHLDKMSTAEKIKTMEIIWDDLCRNADSVSSPSWHKNVLHQREEAIKNGDDEFVEWNSAKKQIRDTIS